MADDTKTQKAAVDQQVADRTSTFDADQATQLGRQTGAANSASAAAVDAIDAKNRELSAVIARYGQQGRQNLERYNQRNTEDMAAAQQQFAVGQGSRQIGTMSDAERAVHTGGLTRQYQRIGQDQTAIGNLRMDAWGQYGGLMAGYMQQAAAASPLIAQQTIADLQARQAAARGSFMDSLTGWRDSQYQAIDKAAADAAEQAAKEAEEAADLSLAEQRTLALAAGRKRRDQEIAAAERALAMWEDAGATQLALSGRRRLQQLRARPESEWATDAAVQQFGDIGYGLFDETGPTAQQQRAAAFDAAGTMALEDRIRAADPRLRAAQVADTIVGRLPAWMRPDTPYTSRVQPQLSNRVPTSMLRAAMDERALSPYAVEYLVQNGMGESDAIEQVYGTRTVDQYGQPQQTAAQSADAELTGSQEYQDAMGWLQNVAAYGGSQDFARQLLLDAGYDPVVVTELLRTVDLGDGSYEPDQDALDGLYKQATGGS